MNSNPASRQAPPPDHAGVRPKVAWALSPVACVGCITIGLTNGAFRTIGPLYAQEMGLRVDQVALFMSLGIAAGAVFQYPLGWLSDRIDRRLVLLLATAGAALSSTLLVTLGGASATTIYAGAFLFGGFSLPLYSLSAAQANDHAKPGQHFELAVGLTLFYALGAAVGPLLASGLIEQLGAPWFFAYTASLHGALVGFILYRMTRRAAVPRQRRTRFVAMLRTSPTFFRLAHPRDREQGG